jgi:hypothetical protein
MLSFVSHIAQIMREARLHYGLSRPSGKCITWCQSLSGAQRCSYEFQPMFNCAMLLALTCCTGNVRPPAASIGTPVAPATEPKYCANRPASSVADIRMTCNLGWTPLLHSQGTRSGKLRDDTAACLTAQPGSRHTSTISFFCALERFQSTGCRVSAGHVQHECIGHRAESEGLMVYTTAHHQGYTWCLP